jgi:hypothetical protein
MLRLTWLGSNKGSKCFGLLGLILTRAVNAPAYVARQHQGQQHKCSGLLGPAAPRAANALAYLAWQQEGQQMLWLTWMTQHSHDWFYVCCISQGSQGKYSHVTREPLLKGKAQDSWSPCTNHFRSAAFDNARKIFFFTRQAYLRKRSAVQSLPLQLVFPCVTVFGWCFFTNFILHVIKLKIGKNF